MTEQHRFTPSVRGWEAHVGYVSDVDYFVSLLAERNVRFDAQIAAVVTDLGLMRDATMNAIDLSRTSIEQQLAEMDRRLQQQFHSEREMWQAATQASTQATNNAVKVALETVDKATSKAETANEKRFDSVNEFRAQLKDQANTFISRVEVEQRLGQMATRIEELRTNDTSRTARTAGSTAIFGWFIGGIGALAAILVTVNAILSK